MDRFKNILVAASPGHLEARTLRAAIRLAATNQATLTLVDVVSPMPRLYRALLGHGRVAEVESGLRQHRLDSLRHLADNTRAGAGIDVTVLEGEPFIEVIRHVLAQGNDLVIVGGDEIERGVTPELSSGADASAAQVPGAGVGDATTENRDSAHPGADRPRPR